MSSVTASDIKHMYKTASQNLVEYRRIMFPDDEHQSSPEFHYRWSDILLSGKKNYAIEAFRESAKTQYCIRMYILYALTYPLRRRSYIAIVKSNKDLARNKLMELIVEHKTHPILSQQIIKINRESGDIYDVDVLNPLTNKSQNVRIETFGKGSAIRGMAYRDKRPNIVICDDLQDTADSASELITDRDWSWFLSDVKFLGKRCRIFLIGNNLGERCIIERIAKTPAEIGFEFERIPKISPNLEQSTWCDRYSVEDILKERENYQRLGKLDVWYREAMCLSLDPAKQEFRSDDFRYFSHLDKPKYERENVFITVDLAISKKTSADYTAIVVNAVNSTNQWFVLDISYGRYDVHKTIDEIFRLSQHYKPITVGIESVGYQAVLSQILMSEMPKRNIFFSIKELKAMNKKEERIRAIQPRIKSHNVLFLANADYLAELESELLHFPAGIHDDLIDALAYQNQIAYASNDVCSNNLQVYADSSYNAFAI